MKKNLSIFVLILTSTFVGTSFCDKESRSCLPVRILGHLGSMGILAVESAAVGAITGAMTAYADDKITCPLVSFPVGMSVRGMLICGISNDRNLGDNKLIQAIGSISSWAAYLAIAHTRLGGLSTFAQKVIAGQKANLVNLGINVPIFKHMSL